MNDNEPREIAEPLEALARRIAEQAEKSDELVVSAAMLVREARRRIEAGEAGRVAWADWAAANINLSKSRLHELQRIAEADDPAAALRELRRETRARVRRHRAKQATSEEAGGDERRRLIGWAKTAPLDQVRQVLELIEEQADAAGPDPARDDAARQQRDAA